MSSIRLRGGSKHSHIGAVAGEDVFPRDKTVQAGGWSYTGILANFMSTFGRHNFPRWNVIVANAILEIVGCIFLYTAVPYAVYLAGGAADLGSSLYVSILSAVLHFAVMRWNKDIVVKRHLNPNISLAYLFMGDVGVPGLLGYWTCQFIGAACAGGILMNLVNGDASVTAVTFPTPLATRTTIVGVALRELFLSGFIVLTLIYNEYVNTKHDAEDGKQAARNYNVGVMNLAFGIVIATLIGFPVKSWTFNPAMYFAGILGQLGRTPDFYAAGLGTYTGTLFDGGAFAIYIFVSMAGTLIGVGVTYLLWATRVAEKFREPRRTAYAVVNPPDVPERDNILDYKESVSPQEPQVPAQETAVDTRSQIRTPLLRNPIGY
jgi:glycerol uptake facilitator-like aquaporin